MTEQNMSNDERIYQYASTYFYFLKVLRILSLEASEQCEVMDNFNVAWELKDEFLRSSFAILNWPEGQLSSDEKKQRGLSP